MNHQEQTEGPGWEVHRHQTEEVSGRADNCEWRYGAGGGAWWCRAGSHARAAAGVVCFFYVSLAFECQGVRLLEAEQTIAALREQLDAERGGGGREVAAEQEGGGREVVQGPEAVGRGAGGGPKRKSWGEIGPDQKKRCTKKMDAQLEELALERSTKPYQIAAYIVKRLGALHNTTLHCNVLH